MASDSCREKAADTWRFVAPTVPPCAQGSVSDDELVPRRQTYVTKSE